MAAKAWQGDSQLTSLLREENIVESRPITPPCRKVVGGPVSNGLLVLPPETGTVHFNSEVTVAAQTNKRHGSADRIQRKLRSVERSNSAGGRLIDERNNGGSSVLEESKKHELVQSDLKATQPSIKKADMPKKISNGTSDTVTDINSSLDKLQVDEDLPIELKAEFLSCVMEKNYEKALHLCEEMLAIDSESKTCIEFQNVIKEKLQQEASSDEENETDESGSTTGDSDDNEESENSDDDDDDDDVDSDDDSDDDSDNDDDDESSEDEDDGENSETDSDIELPPGPINILMGGLPLQLSSVQPNDKSGNT